METQTGQTLDRQPTPVGVGSSDRFGSVDRDEVAETIERLKDEEYERLQRYENNEP